MLRETAIKKLKELYFIKHPTGQQIQDIINYFNPPRITTKDKEGFKSSDNKFNKSAKIW